MRTHQRLDDIRGRSFTAISKVPGRLLSEATVQATLNVTRVVLLLDPDRDTTWVSFSADDYNAALEQTLNNKLHEWRWRRIGNDDTDPEETTRFTKALQADRKSADGTFNDDTLGLADRAPTSQASSEESNDHAKTNGLSTSERTIDSVGSPTFHTDNPYLSYMAQRRLPPEIWVTIFDLAVTSDRSVSSWDFNRNVAKLRQVCTSWKLLIDSTKRFWSRIASRCPPSFNKAIIKKSISKIEDDLPFTVEFVPRVDATPAMTGREFVKLMKLVDPYRPKVSGLEITLPLQSIKNLFKYLKEQAPQLKRLTVRTIPHAEGGQESHGNGIHPDYNLTLLGGECDSLMELSLVELPVRYDPLACHFPNLRKLRLSGKIQIKFASLGAFISRATLLDSLELNDVAIIGPLALPEAEVIHLPLLKTLTFQDLSAPVNMLELFLKIDAPSCRDIDIAFSWDHEPFSEDLFKAALTQLEVKLVATLQTFPITDSRLTSHVRLEKDCEQYRWWIEPIKFAGRHARLRVSLRFKEEETFDWGDPLVTSATTFCRFVHRVLNSINVKTSLQLNALNWLSGTSLELCSQAFDGIDMVDLCANIFDGYFGCLSAFITTRTSRCKSPNLRSLRLTSSVEETADQICGEWLQSFEQFVQTLVDCGYGTRDLAFRVSLLGRFTVSEDTWDALKNGGKVSGVEIDYSAASLRAANSVRFYHGGEMTGPPVVEI
ncbi:hypothetical protein FRB90_011315 [Tulasnella sp. 427]|nr:hypothetical protein FRB90_011315 [Tulasnella sp. 427]